MRYFAKGLLKFKYRIKSTIASLKHDLYLHISLDLLPPFMWMQNIVRYLFLLLLDQV